MGKEQVFEDKRGRIFKAGPCNIVWTKRGCRRAGDIHPNVQYDCVVSGEIMIKTPIDVNYYKRGEVAEIPAGIPHIFESITDSVVVEWWTGPFEAMYWPPYRKQVEETM